MLNLLLRSILPNSLNISLINAKNPPDFLFYFSSGDFASSICFNSLVFTLIAVFLKVRRPDETIVLLRGGFATDFYDLINLHMLPSYSYAYFSYLYCSISMKTFTRSYFTKRLYSLSFSRLLIPSNAKTSGSPFSCSTSNKNSMNSCI